MKLFHLYPVDDCALNPTGQEIWDYDCAFAFVVRAPFEARARAIAQARAGDEKNRCPNVWLNPDYAVCEELLAEGAEGIIVRDFSAG